MYSTCLFCNKPLGENAVLELFPVGRRIAFDAAKGRLWVVCRKCERWNLSPMEERWETIEAAERLFRDTRMRVSTENIGLARHPEGLELVRIGQPQRPEFAAWRYGDQFGRRRKRAILWGVGTAAVVGTVLTAGMATGIITTGLLSQSGNFVNIWANGRVLVRVRTDSGKQLKLRRPQLQRAKLLQESQGDWVLQVGDRRKKEEFRGAEAERILGVIMPKLNASGARSATVQDAVREIEHLGGPQEYLAGVVEYERKISRMKGRQVRDPVLGKLPAPTRLALEMALHEEQERRALEGELKLLELAWQQAEEIAAISDDLLLPESIRARVEADATD